MGGGGGVGCVLFGCGGGLVVVIIRPVCLGCSSQSCSLSLVKVVIGRVVHVCIANESCSFLFSLLFFRFINFNNTTCIDTFTVPCNFNSMELDAQNNTRVVW